MGPLASETHRERVMNHLNRGMEEGARVLLKGEALQPEGARGRLLRLAVAAHRRSRQRLLPRGDFRAVGLPAPFKTEEEAVDLVNRLNYGLANSVWSSDLARANAVAEKLIAGNVWINAHNVFAYGLPYGGVNLSGLGGGVNSGPETLDDYLRATSIARPLA
jgi:acyl-CoA reductase-like NAD-dependent aldehyde dehydrogenase